MQSKRRTQAPLSLNSTINVAHLLSDQLHTTEEQPSEAAKLPQHRASQPTICLDMHIRNAFHN